MVTLRVKPCDNKLWMNCAGNWPPDVEYSIQLDWGEYGFLVFEKGRNLGQWYWTIFLLYSARRGLKTIKDEQWTYQLRAFSPCGRYEQEEKVRAFVSLVPRVKILKMMSGRQYGFLCEIFLVKILKVSVGLWCAKYIDLMRTIDWHLQPAKYLTTWRHPVQMSRS